MVHELFQALATLLAALLVLGYLLLRTLVERQGVALSLRRLPLEVLLFGAVVAWIMVQITPYAPATWHHPLWGEVGRVLDLPLAGHLTLAPGAGFEALMRLLGYALLFWLALQWGRERKRARQILITLTLAATLYASYALFGYLGGNQTLLWVERRFYLDDLTGTMVNRNSFATYLGLGLLLLTGLYLAGWLHALQSGRRGRDRAFHLLRRGLITTAPQIAAITLLLTALLLTHSRAGGSAALLVVTLLLLLLGARGRVDERMLQILILLFLGIVVATLLASGEAWLQRLSETELERDLRLLAYVQTWEATQGALWSGFGAGSFEQTFPLYADHRSIGFHKAHNDWLETLFTLGLPAALLWFGLLGSLAMRCLIGFFRRRRDQLYPLLGFTASLLVGLHALVDFSLQIPAIAITYSVILGVGVAQSWSSDHHD